MASKASEWARIHREMGGPYRISTGHTATVTQDGNLHLASSPVSVDPSPAEAVAFARWILDTFGEETRTESGQAGQ